MTKYELEFSDGCQSYWGINGQSLELLEEDLGEEESLKLYRKMAHAMIDKMDDSYFRNYVFQTLMQDYVEANGEYEDLGYCDQCASNNYSYKTTIEV